MHSFLKKKIKLLKWKFVVALAAATLHLVEGGRGFWHVGHQWNLKVTTQALLRHAAWGIQGRSKTAAGHPPYGSPMKYASEAWSKSERISDHYEKGSHVDTPGVHMAKQTSHFNTTGVLVPTKGSHLDVATVGQTLPSNIPHELSDSVTSGMSTLSPSMMTNLQKKRDKNPSWENCHVEWNSDDEMLI